MSRYIDSDALRQYIPVDKYGRIETTITKLNIALEKCKADVVPATEKTAIPHRNYQHYSAYWCECGWHLGKKHDINYCANCGAKILWDEVITE